MSKSVSVYFWGLIFALALAVTDAWAGCKNGESWVFEIKGQNPVVSRSDEINGTYTLKCVDGKPAIHRFKMIFNFFCQRSRLRVVVKIRFKG